MMSKYKFSNIERYAIWTTFGFKCFWCEEPIRFLDTTIDHIFPEDLENSSEKLNSIIAEYGLPAGFRVNSFNNWVPCHSKCNSQKRTSILKSTPATIFTLSRIEKTSVAARKKYDQLSKDISKDKILGRLLVQLEAGIISRDDLKILLEHTEPSLSDITINENQEIVISVAGDWQILKIYEGQALVTNGINAGHTPIDPNPHISWLCPFCFNYGPWNGVICLSCGRKSDPYD